MAQEKFVAKTIYSGTTDLRELFATFGKNNEELKEYYEKKRLEEEKQNWISENVYHRQILFEKIHWMNKPRVTIYSGSTDLGNIFNTLSTSMSIGFSRGVGDMKNIDDFTLQGKKNLDYLK